MGKELIDRRRQARREAAARACWERFADEGFAEARLESLAGDAGLSKQALLFYFADKADLWAEAVTCAFEEALRVLTRLVTGEHGPVAVRALRRGLDELSRVLPGAWAVLLDAAGSVPRSTPAQQARVGAALDALLAALSTALSASGGSREAGRRLARFAWLTLLSHHREARAHGRAGLAAPAHHPADLDFAEAQLVALAGALSRTRG